MLFSKKCYKATRSFPDKLTENLVYLEQQIHDSKVYIARFNDETM